MAKIEGTRITISVAVPYHPLTHAVTKAGDGLYEFASAFGKASIVSEEACVYDDEDDDE